jgi:hypothetical protein
MSMIPRRLLEEFWLPALVAVAWTIYNAYTSSEIWEFKNIVNVFGPSFFLASWATGQFFRVKKQVNLDKNITAIDSRVESLLEKLEKHTKDFIGYTIGGDSLAYFMPMITQAEIVELGLINQSPYPVFDVQSRLIDLDEPTDFSKGKLWTDHMFRLPSLFPNRIVMGAYRFDIRGRERLYLNIFIDTRGQGTVQQIRIVRVNGTIQIATRTRAGEKVVEQSVPDGFPGWNPEDPNALFN